jgi:flagellar biosynthesis GTPase FlhF
MGYHNSLVGGDRAWDVRGGRGGVWTEAEQAWLPWGEVDGVCGTLTQIKEVFHDGQGVWLHEKEDNAEQKRLDEEQELSKKIDEVRKKEDDAQREKTEKEQKAQKEKNEQEQKELANFERLAKEEEEKKKKEEETKKKEEEEKKNKEEEEKQRQAAEAEKQRLETEAKTQEFGRLRMEMEEVGEKFGGQAGSVHREGKGQHVERRWSA